MLDRQQRSKHTFPSALDLEGNESTNLMIDLSM